MKLICYGSHKNSSAYPISEVYIGKNCRKHIQKLVDHYLFQNAPTDYLHALPVMKSIEIFTDGGCKGNPGPGGYGCIIRGIGNVLELKGSHPQTTNNIMEMTAAIVALKKLSQPYQITLTTDSQYLVKGMTEWIHNWIKKGWLTASKQPVKNKELWQELHSLSKQHKITWIWVKGHAGHPENERCDQLANEAMDNIECKFSDN